MNPPLNRRRVWPAAAMAAALTIVGLAAPTATHAAKPGTGPDCGPRLMKESGGPWQCTFADDFSGDSLDSTKWSPVLTAKTGQVNDECRVDKPDTIGVAGGALHLTVHDRGETFLCETPSGAFETRYEAGGVHSKGSHSQAFGRFEARIKFPASSEKGLHGSWWLWPTKKVYGTLSGELDVAEWRSGLSDRVVPSVHYDDGGLDPQHSYWHCYIDDVSQWHTYAMEWERDGRIRFFYDGELCWEKQVVSANGLISPQPFDEKFFMILNQSVGVGHNAPTDSTFFPATMSVDHVRVWS